MSTAPPAIRDFARRLLALEAARDERPGEPSGGAMRVCDRLRAPLTRLAGVAGFRSLLSRALALAKAEAPALAGAHVRADGTLEGLPTDADAEFAVVTQLLDLLVTFIGEPLTRRLVQDVWPDATATGADAGTGEQP